MRGGLPALVASALLALAAGAPRPAAGAPEAGESHQLSEGPCSPNIVGSQNVVVCEALSPREKKLLADMSASFLRAKALLQKQVEQGAQTERDLAEAREASARQEVVLATLRDQNDRILKLLEAARPLPDHEGAYQAIQGGDLDAAAHYIRDERVALETDNACDLRVSVAQTSLQPLGGGLAQAGVAGQCGMLRLARTRHVGLTLVTGLDLQLGAMQGTAGPAFLLTVGPDLQARFRFGVPSGISLSLHWIPLLAVADGSTHLSPLSGAVSGGYQFGSTGVGAAYRFALAGAQQLHTVMLYFEFRVGDAEKTQALDL